MLQYLPILSQLQQQVKQMLIIVISYLAGKDCRFIRVTKNREVCIQSDSNMAIKDETIETKEYK